MSTLANRRVYLDPHSTLVVKVWNGKEFVGIRKQFNTTSLDFELLYAGSRVQDTGVDLPHDIEATQYLGAVDRGIGKRLFHDSEGRWVYENGQRPNYVDPNFKPYRIINVPLFDFLSKCSVR